MYQFNILSKGKIKHGVLEKKVNLKENRKEIKEKAGKGKVVFPEQTHGNKVYLCKGKERGMIKRVDGLITETPNQILAIRTADCIPLFLYDPFQNKIGLIHAGLKGLKKRIIKKSLKEGNFNKDKVLVGIGPHIRKKHYFLRGRNKKLLKRDEFKKYVYKKEDKLYFSITELVKNQLLKEGVLEKNIEDCGICTYSDSRFLSAREQGENFDCFGSFIKLE